MREIKFRGKFIDGGWIMSDYNTDIDPNPAYSISNFFALVYAGKIDPTTVGQWTGLKDKNGVDIYEGDRINGQSDGITYVEWQDDSWILVFEGETSSCIPLSELTSWGSNEATVIGNIHEVTK